MNRHFELWAAWNIGTVDGFDLIVQKHHDLYICYLNGKGGVRGKNPGKVMEKTLTDLAPHGKFVLNWDEVFDLVAPYGTGKTEQNNIRYLCERLIHEATTGTEGSGYTAPRASGTLPGRPS